MVKAAKKRVKAPLGAMAIAKRERKGGGDTAGAIATRSRRGAGVRAAEEAQQVSAQQASFSKSRMKQALSGSSKARYVIHVRAGDNVEHPLEQCHDGPVQALLCMHCRVYTHNSQT